MNTNEYEGRRMYSLRNYGFFVLYQKVQQTNKIATMKHCPRIGNNNKFPICFILAN